MSRARRPALAAGYLVAFVVVLLGLIVAFGYLGAWEVGVAAVLAVPLTALGARLIADGVEPETDDAAEPAPATAG